MRKPRKRPTRQRRKRRKKQKPTLRKQRLLRPPLRQARRRSKFYSAPSGASSASQKGGGFPRLFVCTVFVCVAFRKGCIGPTRLLISRLPRVSRISQLQSPP